MVKIDSGLYRIQLTSANAVQIYYRLLVACLFENKDKIMVVTPFSHSNHATAQVVHYSKDGKRTWVKSQPFTDQLCMPKNCLNNKWSRSLISPKTACT